MYTIARLFRFVSIDVKRIKQKTLVELINELEIERIEDRILGKDKTNDDVYIFRV